ncbi:MAG: hypothetical protein DMF06_03375 [Verrucomicrobia bacterium]|nr:MAG: hypothetical protein DMF06_03375 [Verrucomicrobiota bacterium]
MNTLRILCVGKITEGDIDWSVAPLPQTDQNMLVSRYMNSINALGTHDELIWDGFHAAIEGQPLCAMPTEAQELGWWRAQWSGAKLERLSEQQEAMLDEEWMRGGM